MLVAAFGFVSVCICLLELSMLALFISFSWCNSGLKGLQDVHSSLEFLHGQKESGQFSGVPIMTAR